MSVRGSLVILSALMVGLPLGVFAVRANQLKNENPYRNLQFVSVQPGDVQVEVTAIGKIEADQVVHLSFNAPGRVTQVLVNPGDEVLSGDLLAQQEDDTQQLAYHKAQLEVQVADLQRQQLAAGPDDGDIRIAQANLNSAWGAYTAAQNAVSPEDIQAAQIRYQQAQQAEADARQARSTAPGGQSEEAYSLLEAQIGQASFNTEIARLQLEQLQNGNQPQLNALYAQVTEAQRQLDQIKAGPTQAQLDNADLALQQAQADLDQAQTALNQTGIRAPFDGIVTAVNAEEGALAAPSLPVVELTDISPLHLTVQVDEIDVRQIREGMPAQIKLDALPGVLLPATLEQIALVGSSDQGIVSYDVKVTLDGSDPRVRVGMTAESSVVVQSRSGVLVVPNSYIRFDRRLNQAYVNIIGADGKLQEIEVTLGLQGEDRSEIISGLKPGDVIAVDLSSDQLSIFGS